MSFKSQERRRQLDWKATTRSLSVEARLAGLYTKPSQGRTPARDEVFLHETRSVENLLPGVRTEALKIFKDANLDWHDGPAGGGPSNYLMDSMVSCVNCLIPFAHDGAALAALFRQLVPNAVGAMQVDDGRVIIFEWLGVGNPLAETSPKRRRSSHGTSADAFQLLAHATERARDFDCDRVIVVALVLEQAVSCQPLAVSSNEPSQWTARLDVVCAFR